MPRKRYSPEEIIHKLREAEVLLSQAHTVQPPDSLGSSSRHTTVGGKSMAGWTRAMRNV